MGDLLMREEVRDVMRIPRFSGIGPRSGRSSSLRDFKLAKALAKEGQRRKGSEGLFECGLLRSHQGGLFKEEGAGSPRNEATGAEI